MVEESSDEEDYQAAGRSTADYADYEKPQKPRNPIWKKLGLALIAILLVGALGAGVYWFAKHHTSLSKSTQSSNANESAAATKARITTETQHYDSANFSLSFDYPGNWKLSDEGNGILIVVSPAVGVKDTNGEIVNSQITLTIRDSTKVKELPGFGSGNALAATNSEKIAYSKPTQNQRANTYLSFLSYADSNTGFDAIYITGDLGYAKDQAIPKTDIQKVDPIISVTFAKCASSQCSGSTNPMSINLDNWRDDSFAQPIKSMLQSLSIN